MGKKSNAWAKFSHAWDQSPCSPCAQCNGLPETSVVSWSARLGHKRGVTLNARRGAHGSGYYKTPVGQTGQNRSE